MSFADQDVELIKEMGCVSIRTNCLALSVERELLGPV